MWKNLSSQIKGPQFYQKGPLFCLKSHNFFKRSAILFIKPQISLKVHYVQKNINVYITIQLKFLATGLPCMHTLYLASLSVNKFIANGLIFGQSEGQADNNTALYGSFIVER